MKVLKFGGTSVGSVEGLANVQKIVAACDEPVIVVVSALGGVTDKLLAISRMSSMRDELYEQEYRQLIKRHEEVVEALVAQAEQAKVKAQLTVLFDELSNILRGVFLIRELSSKTSDTIVSYGERCSSLIIHHIISGSKLFDACELIKTTRQFAKHIVDFEESNRLIKNAFKTLPKISVVPGFIAQDKDTEDTTNLGRGGSDYTAAIIAAALNASMLEIWTDVDGFMTADPRVINTAYVIENLSFVEAMELCNFGAKVIYPPTIFPVFHKNIPVRIKNTFNPTAPGTLISKERIADKQPIIKGISSINDTCLITIRGLGMVGVIGVNYRIFKALAKNGISVFIVAQASSENTTSFGVKECDAELSIKSLRDEFSLEIAQGEINEITAEKDLATVAIVGEGMKDTPGITGKLFGTLGRGGINVKLCAQGALETNISFVIARKDLRKTLNTLHDSFFLSEYHELNIFLAGIGTVGSSLIQQLKAQQPKLMQQNSLKLKVVGIANSKKLLLKREGIDLDNYKEELTQQGIPSSPKILRDNIVEMNIFNSVFVDCTANNDIAEVYHDLLSNNISVVTANKVAASSDYTNYAKLKEEARRRDIKYLFETNVGAGLPIINTINSLINSGDRILKLEAVLSGTLNFIFNTISAAIPFSKTIEMAKEAGYSEPDPRIDLSGTDVVRKLVILARESGYAIEQSDVKKNLFVPDNYFKGSLDDFWKDINKLDTDFEAKRKVLEQKGKRWKFVAKLENGAGEVGLQEVDNRHPFYDLEGSNNIILITSERYKDYPMMIKGYGAGANVTAAGVFADIISIANIR